MYPSARMHAHTEQKTQQKFNTGFKCFVSVTVNVCCVFLLFCLFFFFSVGQGSYEMPHAHTHTHILAKPHSTSNNKKPFFFPFPHQEGNTEIYKGNLE